MEETSNRATNSILIVTGPTASGKTKLAYDLAKKLDGVLINCDSVQFYKGFDIGSAKERYSDIQTYLIDIAEANQPIDVAQFKKLADEKILEVLNSGKTPIIVGGSTMYIKILLHGLFSNESFDSSLRNELEGLSEEELINELKKHDPDTLINIKDRRRLIRALEIARTTGLEKRRKHDFSNLDYDALILVLNPNRARLHEQIAKRSKNMLEQGLVSETKDLIAKYNKDLQVFKSIGYRQVIDYLGSNEANLEQLCEKITSATRRYARQQLTFWRNEPQKRAWQIIKSQVKIDDRCLVEEICHLWHSRRHSKKLVNLLFIDN